MIILGLAVLGAPRGWASSGTTRLGREAGFVGGLFVGLLVALSALPFAGGPGTRLLVVVGIPLVLGCVGAALLGDVGAVIAHGLYRARLGVLDRSLGALISTVATVLVCVLGLHVLLLVAPHRTLSDEARHDVVAHWLLHSHP